MFCPVAVANWCSFATGEYPGRDLRFPVSPGDPNHLGQISPSTCGVMLSSWATRPWGCDPSCTNTGNLRPLACASSLAAGDPAPPENRFIFFFQLGHSFHILTQRSRRRCSWKGVNLFPWQNSPTSGPLARGLCSLQAITRNWLTKRVWPLVRSKIYILTAKILWFIFSIVKELQINLGYFLQCIMARYCLVTQENLPAVTGASGL